MRLKGSCKLRATGAKAVLIGPNGPNGPIVPIEQPTKSEFVINFEDR
jgi:hypothetical protein